MDELFLKKMKNKGNGFSETIRRNNDRVVNSLYDKDVSYKKCVLYSRDKSFLENIEAKFQVSTNYTILKDQVEYLVSFRPHYHPEKVYCEPDEVERLGFYIDIPDDDGDVSTWLIVGRNDRNQFVSYNILKCNWTFKWISNGVLYSVLGVIRSRNSYNSGVWSDGFTTSVENQSSFWLPNTVETQTIYYDTSFIISDSKTRPLVYSVSKIEDTFPLGVTKYTLVQKHYNPHLDNVELGIANYYATKIHTENTEDTEEYKINIDSFNNKIIIGGNSKTLTIINVNSPDSIPSVTEWAVLLNGNPLEEGLSLFINLGAIDANSCSIGIKYDFSILTRLIEGVLIIQAKENDLILADIQLEVCLR